MAKIREDLYGVVIVHIAGQPVMLRSGDDVPEGAVLGGHLVADGVPAGALAAPKTSTSRRGGGSRGKTTARDSK